MVMIHALRGWTACSARHELCGLLRGQTPIHRKPSIPSRSWEKNHEKAPRTRGFSYTPAARLRCGRYSLTTVFLTTFFAGALATVLVAAFFATGAAVVPADLVVALLRALP